MMPPSLCSIRWSGFCETMVALLIIAVEMMLWVMEKCSFAELDRGQPVALSCHVLSQNSAWLNSKS